MPAADDRCQEIDQPGFYPRVVLRSDDSITRTSAVLPSHIFLILLLHSAVLRDVLSVEYFLGRRQ